MRIILLMMILYIGLPLTGLYSMSDHYFAVYDLNPKSTRQLIPLYFIYVGIILFSFLTSHLYFKSFTVRRPPEYEFNTRDLSRTRTHITLFMLVAAVLAFAFGGKDILLGTANRGELRSSFGGFGFLYRTLIVFLVPTALAFSGSLYKLARNRGVRVRFPLTHLVLTVLTTSMMGYKSAILVALIPFFMIIVPTMKFRTQILTGMIALIALVLFSSFIMGLEDQSAVASYLVSRATEGTAVGLVASWEAAANQNPEAYKVLLPVFGPRLTSVLLGMDLGTVEQLKFSAGRYVSYLVHPNPELVLSGQTNLTITLAGEALYLIGREAFWFIGIPVGVLIGIFTGLFTRANKRNDLVFAPLLAIYIVNICLPVLNSGGIVGLYSAYTFFYMGITFIFISILDHLHGGALTTGDSRASVGRESTGSV